MTDSFKLGEKKRKYNPGPSYDFEINLYPPTHDLYPEFDVQELTELQKNVERTDDQEERIRARKVFQRALRGESRPVVNKFYQLSKGDGYDKNDPFIDDSEEFDEMVPPSIDTIKGGFYVNRGLAELKEVENVTERIAQARPKDYPDEDKIKRMRNILKQKFDDKKKRLKDQAKLMKRKQKEEKMLAKYGSAEDKARMSDATSNMKLNNQSKRFKKTPLLPEATNQNQETVISDASKESSPIKEATKILAKPVEAEKDDDNLPLAAFATGASATPSTSQQGSLVKRKPVELNDETIEMIEEFKKTTQNLAAPGQKKRLQRDHVLMLIAIEDKMMEQKMNTHERSRVIQGIADFIGIQKQSLYIRMKAIRDEGKKDAEISETSQAITQNASATPVASSANSPLKAVVDNKTAPSQTPKAPIKPTTTSLATKALNIGTMSQNNQATKQNGSSGGHMNGKQSGQSTENSKSAAANQIVPNLSSITQEEIQKKFEAVYTAFSKAYKEALEKAELDFVNQKLRISSGEVPGPAKKSIKFDSKLNASLIDLALFSIGVAKVYENKQIGLRQILVSMFDRCLKETPGPITTDEFLQRAAKECPKASELLKAEAQQIMTKPKPLANRIDQGENRGPAEDKKASAKMKVASFTCNSPVIML